MSVTSDEASTLDSESEQIEASPIRLVVGDELGILRSRTEAVLCPRERKIRELSGGFDEAE